jgi:hypothetical protein
LMAAADAIAQLARPDEFVPDPLDKSVHERVAAAVRDAASLQGQGAVGGGVWDAANMQGVVGGGVRDAVGGRASG